jgi:hypothetical protein
MLCRRTFRNLTSSFEGWAYREGLHGRLAALERRELLESAAAEGGGPEASRLVVRLTEAGRLHALGGRQMA